MIIILRNIIIAPKRWKVDKFSIQTLIPSSMYIMTRVCTTHMCLTSGHDKIAHNGTQKDNNKQPGAVYIILLLLHTHLYVNIKNTSFDIISERLSMMRCSLREVFTFKLFVMK